MNKSKMLLIVVFLFLSTAVFAQSKSIKVGVIDNTDGLYDNCGMNLTFAGRETGEDVFISSYTSTLMKIDGKIVELKLIKSTAKDDGDVKKGETFTDTYSAKGLKVTANFTVMGLEEDTIKYKATITVTKGKAKKTVNVVGWSGC